MAKHEASSPPNHRMSLPWVNRKNKESRFGVGCYVVNYDIKPKGNHLVM